MSDSPPTLIKICTGPGCKAWNSIEILEDLPEALLDFENETKICETSCLNKCGGGATIQVNGNNSNIIKVRKPHQIIDQILPCVAQKVQA